MIVDTSNESPEVTAFRHDIQGCFPSFNTQRVPLSYIADTLRQERQEFFEFCQSIQSIIETVDHSEKLLPQIADIINLLAEENMKNAKQSNRKN